MARFRLKIRLSYGWPATASNPKGRHKYGGRRRGLAEPRKVGTLGEPLAPSLRTRVLCQPSYGPRLKGVYQLSWSTEDAATLYAIIGRRRPLSSNSPTGSTVTALSTASMTRGLIRIWPVLASSQRRDATLETVPIAA